MKNLNIFLIYAAVVSSLLLLVSPLRATTCANAIPITAFPVIDQTLVCGTSNDLSAATVPAVCGTTSNSYKIGNEALYSFTPSSSGAYWINYNQQIANRSIFVYDGCPTEGGICVGSFVATNSPGVLTVNLTAGVTYYIWFDAALLGSICSGTFRMIPAVLNDACTGAIPFPAFPADGSCTAVTGSTVHAIQENDFYLSCGNWNVDDIWYTFTTPPGTTYLVYDLVHISGYGLIAEEFQVYQGTCSNGLTSMGCYNATHGVITGLNGNTTYYIQAYKFHNQEGSVFEICLRRPAANDNCAQAMPFPQIPLDHDCASVTVNTVNASNSNSSTLCGGEADDDLWFTFTTPPGISELFYTNTNFLGSTDYEMQLYGGNCTEWIHLDCYYEDSGHLSDLTPNTTYYLRVYTYDSDAFTKFDLCLRVQLPNDECAGAIAFPAIPTNGNCATITANTINASGPTSLNCGGTPDDNIWFSFVTPPGTTTLQYDITPISGSTDMILGLVQGNCTTGVGCFDAESGTFTGLTANTLYKMYVFTKGVGVHSVFDICLRTPSQPANDACQGATPISILPDGSCVITTISTIGATGSNDPTCAGVEDDDVWYTFTTPPGITAVYYGMTNVFGSDDRYLQVYAGTCPGALTSLGCYNAESSTITGLTGNTTYYLRAFTSGAGVTSIFNLCLGGRLQPANDDCAGATTFPELPSDGSCATVTVNTTGASGALDATCTGAEDDDVWYTFTTPQGVNSVAYNFTDISGNNSRAFQVFQGTCNGLASIGCYNPVAGGIISGLNGGTTYYLRVYTQSAGAASTFQLCLRVMPPPVNDNCSAALTFPDIPLDGSSATATFTTFGATGTPDNTCQGTEDDDVWLTFTIPQGVATLLYNYTPITGDDESYFQLFSGVCGNLTSIGCYTTLTGFIPNLNSDSTYYLRIYTRLANVGGIFQLSLKAASVNDECSGALALPDFPLNGDCVQVFFSRFNATPSDFNGTSCSVIENADLWYTFSVPPGVSYLFYEMQQINNEKKFQVLSSDCSGLTSLGCYQNNAGIITGLSSGVIYYLRAYSTSTTNEFNICLRAAAPNDACMGAIAFPSIPADGSCAIVAARTANATGTADPTCTGTEDDDLWYTFTTPPGVTSLLYSVNANTIYFQLFSGNECSGLTSIGCYTSKRVLLTGLTGNTTYYMRVYYGLAGNTASIFDICLRLPPPNDNCSGAIAFPDLPLDGNCASATASTIAASGTLSSTCTGSEDDDVWFSFTMPQSVGFLSYEILPISGDPDVILELFSGTCGNLIHVGCYDPQFDEENTIGLTGGATYYLRAYTWANETNSTFSICLKTVRAMNDNCDEAFAFPDIPLDGSCASVSASTAYATGTSDPACVGSEDDDVWFTFTTPPGISSLGYTTSTSGSIDPVLQVFSGECGNLTSIGCYNPSIGVITGLSGSTIYYLRAYGFATSRGSFDICLQLLPVNDECTGAIAFPTIPADGSCATLSISTKFATGTLDPACAGAEDDDVWYTFTTPANTTTLAFMKTGSDDALDFQLFSDSCNNLTPIGCFVDLDFGLITGLSDNTTYYLRAYTPYDGHNTVDFCLQRLPLHDNCSGAISFPAIPLDGSCASVSASTIGATGSASPTCVGVEDDDLWYTFTTPPGITSLRYEITNIFAFFNHESFKDLVFEIFSNSCGDQISIGCYDLPADDITGLNGNTTYYMRVYTKAEHSPHNETTFDICLRLPPSNDNCPDAIAFPELPPDGSCAAMNVSLLQASPSGVPDCMNLNYPDVWYTFTTPLHAETVWYQLPGVSFFDAPLLEIFSGSCTDLTSIGCYDEPFGAFTGLVGGTTYYLRAHPDDVIYPITNFTLCLRSTPVNDLCQNATAFPAIPADGGCSTVIANTARAAGPNDVWFTFTTPPNAKHLRYESSIISGPAPGIGQCRFQILSGPSCDQLTPIGCYNTNQNGIITDLTGNTTYYLRAFGSSLADSVAFSICLKQQLINDYCTDATLIGGCNATITGDFYGATTDGLDNDCVVNIDQYTDGGLWYRMVGDGNPVMIHTCVNSNTGTGIAVYSGACGSLVCVTANEGACTTGSQVNWLTTAGEEYYLFVYPISSPGNETDFTLSLIGGAQCPNVIGQATVSINGTEATISWPVAAGVESYEYVLSTSGSCSTGTVQTTTGNSVSFSGLETNIQYTFCLRSQCSCYDSDFTSITFAIPLSNDYCTTAVPIACGSTITGNTTGALSDSSLGACGGQSGLAPGNGIWYTIPGDGSLITLDLCASTFDTKVHVYSGTCNNSLLCVANNDDACGSQSKVSFLSSPGLNYFILVSGSNFSNGDFNMDVSCVCEEPLTTPWTTTSIGGLQGTAINNHCGRTIDISAEGASPSGSNDQQFFAFQNFCDTLTITTKVNSIANGGFAGIAFRESEAPGSRMVALKLKKGKYVYREVRNTTNGPKSTQQFFTTGHKWLRIVRNGNSFIGYSSSDGVNWLQHFSTNLAMPSCIDAGLFAESTHPDSLAVGAFSNVSMLPSTSTVVTPGGDVPTGEFPTGDGTSGYIIYPNPTQALINVEMDNRFLGKALTITINNQFGQMMTIRKIDEVEDPIEIFNVQHLPPGVYIMTLRTDGGEAFAKKFVVVR